MGQAAPSRRPLTALTGDLVDAALTANDGRAVVIGGATGKGNGIDVDQELFHLFTVRSGKITRWKMYLDRDQAFEDAGMRA
jgi:ketosteroid isomerase-like protein